LATLHLTVGYGLGQLSKLLGLITLILCRGIMHSADGSLWTARTLQKAFEAISLVSNPPFSNALIKARYDQEEGG